MTKILSENELEKVVKRIIKEKNIEVDFSDPNVFVTTFSSNMKIADLFIHGVTEIYFDFNGPRHVEKDNVPVELMDYMKDTVARNGIEIRFYDDFENELKKINIITEDV